MSSSKQGERRQRFKIQVIKKKVKRLQSTPQKHAISAQKIDRNIEDLLSKKLDQNSKEKDLLNKNPQQIANLSHRHGKSKSQLWMDQFYTFPEFQSELGLESIVINSIMQKNIYRGYSTLEESPLVDMKMSTIIEKKLSEQKMVKRDSKMKASNPFEDLNIVKCQSITLLKANKRSRADVRPSKYLNKQSSISRRKIKIASTNSSKIMSFNLNGDTDAMYMRKLKIHLDFLFKVNFSNRIFINFDLKQSQHIKKYKVYVGWGNNHPIIKNCLKNRFWIDLVDRLEDSEIRFIWTQWPNKQFYDRQCDRIRRNEQCPLINTNRVNKVEEETLNYNEKLFIGKESHKVEHFIVPDGYIIPFSEYKSPQLIINHLSNSAHISQKKKLFHSLFRFYRSCLKQNPFNVIPVTYNVANIEDPEFKRFLRDSEGKEDKVWIIKPGQNTNRGEGICLAKTQQVANYIAEGVRQTYVIQSYIDRPLLYNGRKFDLRHFVLITSINGFIKAYWFKQGYVRTSSQMFDIANLADKFIHLTNDAIQQHSKNYGVYEPANKISYSELQRYLEVIFPKRNVSLQAEILDKMKEVICNVVKANYKMLDRKQKEASFELFGIDFMIDRDLKPWLIEINENPCLETNCHLLSRLIPSVIENTLRLCLDPLFPPLNHFPARVRSSLNDHYLKSLKFQIIFDQCEYQKEINGKFDTSSLQTY